jgi:hypothetical protein
MPAFPAYCALMASIPLLWPRTGVRLPDRFPYAPRRLLPVAVPAAIFLLVPLAAVAASKPLHHEEAAAEIGLENLFVPLGRDLHVRVTNDDGAVTLRWSAIRGEHANVFYGVYRSPARSSIGKGSEHLPVIRGIFCEKNPHGAVHCTLEMARVATTRGTVYREGSGSGTWTYRVAVVANWLNDPTIGDPYYISGPVTVHVP